MTSCCDPGGYGRVFGDRFARRASARYRRRGLDATARRMVEFLDERGLDGASVLEIGGGIGEIEVELLKRGADRSLNLELSDAYDAEARELLQESGLEQRAERRVHDIAAQPEGVEAADVVVLHRVVCCYPDYERLLTAAALHARRALVFSHPPRNPISRAFTSGENLLFRLRGIGFRTFAHPPAEMRAVVERLGLRLTFSHHGLVWHAAGFER